MNNPRNFKNMNEPRRKKNCKLPQPDPLPLIYQNDGKLYKFKGIFDGFSVNITDENEMKKIVSMGYFGKGNLSRSYPSFENKLKTEIIRHRQFLQRKEWSQKSSAQINKIIVVPDSDEDIDDYFTNLKTSYEIDKSGQKEQVQLLLEEAFFLSSALECLEIYFNKKLCSNSEIWDLFCQSNKKFPIFYAVYFYFRAKNWVVKPGIKFGGDFLLYKEGPPFYHASYVVIIKEVYNEDDLNKDLDFTSLMGLHRLCENSGKELLICVTRIPNKIITPDDINNITINEILMKRWVPNQELQQNA